MPINKVVFGNESLMDISGDTVTKETLMKGITAHDKTGALITGIAAVGGKNYILNPKANAWTRNSDGSYQQSFTVSGITESTKISPSLGCIFDTSVANNTAMELSLALSCITKISTKANTITLICARSSPEVDITNLTLTEM